MDGAETINRSRLWTRSFASVTIVNFFMYTSVYMLMSTLPVFIQAIGGNKFMAGLVSGIFTMTGFLSRPGFGSLLDRRGRKAVMLAGIVVMLAATASYNIVNIMSSVALLLTFRIIQGIGWSATTTSTSTIASDLIPVSRRTEGMGYFGISSSVAMAVGPALGLYIIGHYNYILLFVGSSLFIILGLIIGCSLNLNSEYNPMEKNDLKRNTPVSSVKPGKGFGGIEKSALGPAFLFFFISITYSGIVTFLPSYAGTLGIKNIGIFFSVYAIALLFTRPTMGMVADRFGTTTVVIPGMIFLIIALQMLVRANSLPLFLIAAVLYGLGYGSVQPVLNALTVSLAPEGRRGAANAVFLAAMDIGMGVGSVMWGIISQKFGFNNIYGISSVLVVIAVVMYFIVLRRKIKAW